jgi:peptidylprolyl isomerase
LRAVLVVLALAATSAGCRIPTGDAAPSRQEVTTTHDLGKVDVSLTDGAEPVITVPAPFSVDTTTARVVAEGAGRVVATGQQVVLRYAAVNGTDGKTLRDKTWTGEPTTLVVGAEGNVAGLDEGLRGLRVGSTALIAFPPDDGYGVQGNTSLGVGPTDTIVCLVEVLDARPLLTKANGKPVAARKGLPTVKRAASGEPTVTLPTAAAPTTLVVQPLLSGAGRAVAKGDRVTVQYVGVVWPGGQVFDNSWTEDEPASFTIGANQTISGWDAVIGQKVGSQLLLVVPPDKAYGVEGRDEFGIKGTDTLVFVVDLLDARPATG